MGKKRQLLLSRQPANEYRTDGVRQPPLGENQHWLLEQAECWRSNRMLTWSEDLPTRNVLHSDDKIVTLWLKRPGRHQLHQVTEVDITRNGTN